MFKASLMFKVHGNNGGENVMEKRYLRRNVDLSLLSERIVQFFREKGFKTLRKEEMGVRKIIVRPTHVHEIVERFAVYIFGSSNDFVVRLSAGARSASFVKFGLLITLFGGGSLFLRGVKSQEALEKLERDFCIYLEEKIDFLGNSAKHQEK